MENYLKIEIKVKTGIYKHWKGGLYEVLYNAKHSETLEDVVIYRHIGNDIEKIWVRPTSNFVEYIEEAGKTRFVKVENFT